MSGPSGISVFGAFQWVGWRGFHGWGRTQRVNQGRFDRILVLMFSRLGLRGSPQFVYIRLWDVRGGVDMAINWMGLDFMVGGIDWVMLR